MALFHHYFLLFSHLVVVVVITITVIWVFKTLMNPQSKSRTPPGRYGFPLIHETLSFIAANHSSKGCYDFVMKRHLRYGSCFKTNIFGGTHVFVSSIEAARAVLGSDSANFTKRYIRSIAELLGDHSLLCASHEQHGMVRRRIFNAFTVDSIASSIRAFDELTVKALGSWEQREHILVLDDALEITFNAMCKMLISSEGGDELENLRKDVSEVSEGMLSLPSNLPGTRFNKGLKARKRIMNVLRKKISMRMKGLECPDDFLQSLLKSDDPLTGGQILDNILTLIIAGQDTTANAIAWMVKYLDENQEVQERLRALQLELALRIGGSYLSLEALNEMAYASKVVKETLRMSSIVSWLPRVALKDCEIDGFQIRKGWTVNVDARWIHFDSTMYEDPLKFNPSRFNEDPKPYSFLAFGLGGRACLGMNLAKAMVITFLHRLTTTYKWKVTDPDPSLEKYGLFPRLRSRCPIHVTRI